MKDLLFLNLVIEKIEYNENVLYIFYKHKTFKKILKLKNVNSFTSVFTEHIYYDRLLEKLKVDDFKKIFYRNYKEKTIYMIDSSFRRVIIKFNEQKEWNYRE